MVFHKGQAQFTPNQVERMVSYSLYSNFGKDIDTALLIESAEGSLFFLNNQKSNGVLNEEKGEDQYRVVVNNQFIYSYLCDRKNGTAYFVDEIFSKKLTVYEDPPMKLDWNVTGNFKIIKGKFECYEALTDFRGRSYRAWFCPNIQSVGGPWKLNGLPGLILEVEDTRGYFAIRFNEILEPKNDELLSYAKHKFGNLSLKNSLPVQKYKEEIDRFIKGILLMSEVGSDCVNCETKISSKIEMLEYF